MSQGQGQNGKDPAHHHLLSSTLVWSHGGDSYTVYKHATIYSIFFYFIFMNKKTDDVIPLPLVNAESATILSLLSRLSKLSIVSLRST